MTRIPCRHLCKEDGGTAQSVQHTEDDLVDDRKTARELAYSMLCEEFGEAKEAIGSGAEASSKWRSAIDIMIKDAGGHKAFSGAGTEETATIFSTLPRTVSAL